MVRITKELLKKRAEHNDGILSTLEEITLHQYNIEKIECVQRHCRRLKILYLQNNLIERIEGLYKLKELEYLNLALNNISKIEGLSTCESLTKLDLTLNFIDIDELRASVHELKDNRCLRELHLTGNPCTDYARYRLYVIYALPQLRKLDSVEIKASERIRAQQSRTQMQSEISEAAKQKRSEKLSQSDNAEGVEFEHSVRGRKAAYLKEREREEKEAREAEAKAEQNPFQEAQDAMKETRRKMCAIAEEGENGELPKQRNIGRYAFRVEGGDDIYAAELRAIVEAPQYLDTSELFVDIHPRWLQCIIKAKSLVLHLPVEVKVSECRVRRVRCNGWLELIMPKVEHRKRPKQNLKCVRSQTETVTETKVQSIAGEEDADDDDAKAVEASELGFDEDEVPPLE